MPRRPDVAYLLRRDRPAILRASARAPKSARWPSDAMSREGRIPRRRQGSNTGPSEVALPPGKRRPARPGSHRRPVLSRQLRHPVARIGDILAAIEKLAIFRPRLGSCAPGRRSATEAVTLQLAATQIGDESLR